MPNIDIRFVAEDTIFSRVINWFTQAKFSHVGAMMINGQPYEVGARLFADGAKAGGVQSRPANYAKFTRQQTLSFSVNGFQFDTFWAFIRAQMGKPYDKTAILGFLTERDWHDPKAWFCSELITAALEKAGIIRPVPADVWKITPEMCYLICSQAGATPIPPTFSIGSLSA